MSKPAHGGLGKGLGALLKDKNPKVGEHQVQEIPVEEIQANRYQPRTDFDEEAMDELRNSVQQYGILQPLLVRKLPTAGYELIAGERRFRAAKLAGLKVVPVIVRTYSDHQITEVALIENLQRENLNAIEEAKAYDRLLADFGLTQELLSQKVGRSRSHIANFLRLLRLSERIQAYVADGSLSMGQAKPLLSLEDESLQLEAADFIIAEGLSARDAEALVKRLQKNPDFFKQREQLEDQAPAEDTGNASRDIFVTEAEDKLKMLFGTQVRIHAGKKKSKIEIEFYTPEDLDRIIEALTEKKRGFIESKKEALRKVSLSNKFSV